MTDDATQRDQTASRNAEATWVAGADGFRDGWVVALWQPATGTWRRRTVDTVADLLTLPEAPVALGLDMVIGLPNAARPGGRACDQAARQLLGHPRSSSVFSPPVYDALSADSYEEAQRVQRASAPNAPGLTIQTYHLLPKLRAVATAMTPDLQGRVREVHPELAFYAMNDDAPVAASKHDAAGRAARIRLLETHGCPDIDEAVDTMARGAVGADDVLDAHAACWTARRIHNGTAQRCPPDDPPRNARGLRMEIWR